MHLQIYPIPLLISNVVMEIEFSLNFVLIYGNLIKI